MNQEQKRTTIKEMADAIQRNNEFFTFIRGQEVVHVALPSPQRVGTSMQRRTYAETTAQRIIENATP